MIKTLIKGIAFVAATCLVAGAAVELTEKICDAYKETHKKED